MSSPESFPLPTEAPVMFLPNTVLLPNVMLPLYIFEPRYRAMLAHALEAERMFCIALMRPGVEEARSWDDFFSTAGLGLVRACVGRDDGTSHLVLQGVARVELKDFVQEKPFRIAGLEVLRSRGGRAAGLENAAEEIREKCVSMLPPESEQREAFRKQIEQVRDLGTLCDVVTHTFLRDPLTQQSVLEERSITRRVETVLEHLRAA